MRVVHDRRQHMQRVRTRKVHSFNILPGSSEPSKQSQKSSLILSASRTLELSRHLIVLELV